MASFNSDSLVEKEIIKLRDFFKIKTAIETGTYLGETTKFFCDNFERVYGIEISENYYNKTAETCGNSPNLNLIKDSSVNYFNQKLKEISENEKNILFYLDAHWDNYWPLRDEIKSISKNFYDKAIIVIDDFYVPNRDFQFDTYNGNICNFEYIKDVVEECYSDFSFYFLNKSLRNLPKRDGNIGGVGKVFIIPNNLIEEYKIEKENLFFLENNYYYSITN
jgi:hypothetical protein